MEIEIDCSLVKNEADFHNLLADKLAFPNFYGKNLDALYDILRERDESMLVVFMNSSNLKPALGDRYEKFIKVLEDAKGGKTRTKNFFYHLA